MKEKVKKIIKKAKEFDYKDYISTNKLFFTFVLTTLINGMLLRFFTVHNYFAIKPIMADLALILLLGSFVYLFKPKNRFKYLMILSIIFTAVCVINSLYYTYYMSFASFSLIAVSLTVVDVGDAVVKNVLQFKDFMFLWQPIVLIILHSRLKKKDHYNRVTKKENKKKRFTGTLILGIVVYALFFMTVTGVEYSRLSKQWNREFLVEKFGVYTYQLNDLFKSLDAKFNTLFGYDNAAKDFREFYSSKEEHKTNEYTDKFKGKNVIVIGGGNTAMDTARAAKRTEGVEHVYLVYRRTKRYMPAAEDELLEVLEEGVEFKELLSPVSLENGRLICKKMELGKMDASGRASVTETADVVEVPADTVIVAVGEKIDTDFYTANQIAVDERGKAKVNDKTLETSVSGVYVAGDGARGAATIVEGIRDAQLAVKDILGKEITKDAAVNSDEADCFAKKGILKHSKDAKTEEERCLTCNKVCENCVDVCPNRANISIKVPGMAMNQIIHVDYMCNECGNCKSFCPYASAPYKDKFTLFASEKDMADSTNDGFVVLDKETKTCKVRFVGQITDCKADDPADKLYDGLKKLICAVIDDYGYLI